MNKYTKRQYLADIAANEAAIETVKAELESYIVRIENGEKMTEELSNAWNAAHDREWEIEQERLDIERRWTRRNWNAADYATYDLVAANID